MDSFDRHPNRLGPNHLVRSKHQALSEAGAAGVGFMGLAFSLVTAEAVREARKAGVELGAWTVNEPDVMRVLIDQGIGVLITDRPDVAKNLLSQRRSP